MMVVSINSELEIVAENPVNVVVWAMLLLQANDPKQARAKIVQMALSFMFFFL